MKGNENVNGILIVNTICEYNIKHFSFCIVNSIPLAFLIGGQPMHQQKKTIRNNAHSYTRDGAKCSAVFFNKLPWFVF